MPSFQLWVFSLPAEQQEQLTAELWGLGALGFEIHEAELGRLRLDAYFPDPVPGEGFDVARWRGLGVDWTPPRELADRDWLEPYRAAAEPFDVGEGFRVDPGDPAEPEPGNLEAPEAGSRHLLRIPARTAFGTGSHESTRLVLEWLEDLDLRGLTILDFGTGSGILCFAAKLLGARRVLGFDIDAQAVCVARGNARLNSQAATFFAGGIDALRGVPGFDLALVNILPESFAGEIPRLRATLKAGARVLSSGNLESRRGDLLARWQRCGFELVEERQQAEWVAFLLGFQPQVEASPRQSVET